MKRPSVDVETTYWLPLVGDSALQELIAGVVSGQQYTRLTKPVLIVCLDMANTKPFVALACICEKVIQEGEVLSLIRVVDTFFLEIPPNLPDGVAATIELHLVVSLKSGDVKGESDVSIILRSPDGKVNEPRKWPIILEGGVHGSNLNGKVHIVSPKYGLYWFDVVWNGDVLTSVPFKIVQASESTITN